jgi:hypothetical protein
MTSEKIQIANESKVRLLERYFLMALGALLLCGGISGVSLWIDEGYSVQLAVQTSLTAWAHTLNSMRGSEPQMPGYLLYLWAWARVFGTSEWALRLANVPWAVLLTASLGWGAERVLNIRRAWLIICLSPFLWFYMNEARPYAMVMGISMITTIAVVAYAENPQRFPHAPWWGMVSLLVLWSIHMLTIVLAPSLLLFIYAMRTVSIKQFIKQWSFPVFVTAPGFVCLAAYYLCTLSSGKGGMIEKPGLPNLAFAIYEFLGFGGLGPPRNVLREAPSLHTFFPYLPSLALGVVAFGVVLLAILLHKRDSTERKLVFGLSISLAAGLLLTLALSYAAHFRVLGRHMAAFFPLFILLLLTGLLTGTTLRHRKLEFCALLLLGAAWSISDFRQRLLKSYEKDDYRDAAALARSALLRGEPVLWLAYTGTARYYGLRITELLSPEDAGPPDATAAVSGVCSRTWFEQSLQEHRPVLVVISDKPDLFDRDGNCRRTLDSLSMEHVASFPAFDAWQVTGVKSSSGKF